MNDFTVETVQLIIRKMTIKKFLIVKLEDQHQNWIFIGLMYIQKVGRSVLEELKAKYKEKEVDELSPQVMASSIGPGLFESMQH